MRLAGGVAVALVALGTTPVFAAETSKDTTVKQPVQVASVAPKPEVEQSEPVSVTKAEPTKKKPRAVAPSLVARIDLTEQRMVVTSNGREVGNWKISSGKAGHETPPGRFRPTWTSKMHYSRKYYNSPMPYSVFFNGGIATHGTSYNRMLGRPASHGCIRLRTANARTFYNLVHRHGHKRTRIIVTGRARQYWASNRSGRRSQAWQGNQTRTPARRSATRRENAFGGGYLSGQRLTLNQYNHIRRQQRNWKQRWVYPGD